MKDKMLSRWKNTNTNDYFKEALEIYNNLENYSLDYSVEDLRYVFCGEFEDGVNYLYLNNLENLNRIELTDSKKFLDNIDKDLFSDILNELDERLFLTCNEIIFLMDKDNRDELLDLNIRLDADDSGLYHAARNIIILNVYALMECAYTFSNCYEQFKIVFSFMFLHALIETLCNYNVYETFLPDKFNIGGNSSEQFHLYSFKAARLISKSFNLDIFKENFLSGEWQKFKENPPAPIEKNEDEKIKDKISFNGKGIEINIAKDDMSILDALFDFLK